MLFKNLCVLILWKKVTSALEGLTALAISEVTLQIKRLAEQIIVVIDLTLTISVEPLWPALQVLQMKG